MHAAGCHLYQHMRKMAYMGFAAVLRNMGQVKQNFRITEEALLFEQPDVLILIDYPSFNLRIASFCRKHLPGTRIVYYIPPKVWAWKRRRIHQIAKLCDEVLGIFPFEPDFYARYGYRCTYVGNPTAEVIGKGERLKGKGERNQTIRATRTRPYARHQPLSSTRGQPPWRPLYWVVRKWRFIIWPALASSGLFGDYNRFSSPLSILP